MTHFPDDKLTVIEALLRRPPDPFAVPEHTQAFEAALAQYFGVQEAVAVSSGTAAIHCALAASDIGPGDEVLVPALSVVMSAVPILYQQATPVFVDCQLGGRVDFDYRDLKRKTTARTRAILPVHLWGCSYDMPQLMAYAQSQGLLVIEDACQAHGTQWRGSYLGSWGDFGCFSMKDGKLLSTGEGGFILLNRSDLAQRCRSFRSHWASPSGPACSYERLGQNYRITEAQALLGHTQLQALNNTLSYRRWQAEYIFNGLADLQEIELYPYAREETPNYFSPVFLLRKPLRRIAELLSERGVRNSIGTFGLKPAGEWPVFSGVGETSQMNVSRNGAAPNTTNFLSRVLALILLPQYATTELDVIISVVKTTIEEEMHIARETGDAS